MDIKLGVAKGGFSFFFHRRGGKIFRWGASHIQYATLDASGGTSNGKPKCARGLSDILVGLNTF